MGRSVQSNVMVTSIDHVDNKALLVAGAAVARRALGGPSVPDVARSRTLPGGFHSPTTATYHRVMRRPKGAIALTALLLSFAAGLEVGAAHPVTAQDGGLGAAPGVGQVPPPAWVQPGARVTFYSAAAAVAQSRYQIIEDPDGAWQDPVTGKRYRSTEDTGESVGGASGDGVSQVDVVAVEGNDVVLSLAMYGIDRGTGTLVVQPGVGAKVPGGAIDGLWIAPQLLGQLQTGSLGGLLVLRGDYTLNGTTYQAVSVVNPTPGAYSSQTFDTATGVLLASTTNTAGAISPIRLEGRGSTQGASQLTISRFVSIRQMSTPGIGSTAPRWVAGTPELSYAGQYRWVNPVDPSSGDFTYPMTALTTFTASGPTWATFGFRSVANVAGVANPSESTGVSSGTGPYWWDPAALQGFSVGQILDTDPVTTMTVSVAETGQGPSGPAVTIASQIPGTTGLATFDVATGVLVGQQISVASNGTTVLLALQQMP